MVTWLAFPSVLLAGAFCWPRNEPDVAAWRARISPRSPREDVTAYWIGHSLVAGRDEHVAEPRSVLEKVGVLASSLGLRHHAFEQTSWGAPLSLHVRGRAFGFDRVEPGLPDRLEELRRHGARYDTLLLTDTVPLSSARRWEHTDRFASELACELWRQRPDARVLVHETWVPLQRDPDGREATWRFSDVVEEERAEAEGIAAAVTFGRVEDRGPWGRLTRWFRPASCEAPSPVTIVPVASCLAHLAEDLERDPSWGIAVEDFFANPERHGGLRYPNEPFDDIHGSDLGIYFSALVHFAVLFGRDPTDAANDAAGLAPDVARRLRAFAWRCVRDDPGSGVR